MAYQRHTKANIMMLVEKSTTRMISGLFLLVMVPVVLWTGDAYSAYAIYFTVPVAAILLAAGLTLCGGRETVMVDKATRKLSTQTRWFMFKGERFESAWYSGDEIHVVDLAAHADADPSPINYQIQIGAVPIYETHSEKDARDVAFCLSDFLDLPVASTSPSLRKSVPAP